MSRKEDTYIPAFRYRFLTPLYDFTMRKAMRESLFKRRLVEQAGIEKGHRVLDIGCGTATLTILIKRTMPEAQVCGVDVDRSILRIAKLKTESMGVDVDLTEATALELPYIDGSFHRAVSSMVLHHLNRENKIHMLEEALRTLKAGGELHLADFGKPRNLLMRMVSLVVGRLEENSDNVRGLLPDMLRLAGFDRVEETARFTTLFGTVTLLRARRAEGPVLTQVVFPLQDSVLGSE